ncbi:MULTISPECIES: putative phage tail assembly chaperone [unclassified Pseudomonas]|uniref:putative phage tail assembly chaperone n=1 Tax=unclassified Pseudomonas TaxID=196821 RepID=UPI000C2FB774|nr:MULTISPECIES: putative phage tail assembly chaperone [unclassified Pseudomonas]MCU1740032.1 putative phage tail assembly chaperone [Pseudomonas sp. 20S_6.2_Bac1]
MNEHRDITLAIGEQDFIFTLAPQDVTKYFNAVTPNNKVAPSNNLLTNTVKADQREALRPFLRNPMTTLQLAGLLLEEYAPDIEVVVKKPSHAQTD